MDRNFILALQDCIHGMDSNFMMPGGQVPETDKWKYVYVYVAGSRSTLNPRVWCLFLEVYIVVLCNTGNKEHQLFDSFYHLITSINIICSFSTSDVEADAYMEAYVKYQKSIQDLFPYYPKSSLSYAQWEVVEILGSFGNTVWVSRGTIEWTHAKSEDKPLN